jgi:hypothetical protein
MDRSMKPFDITAPADGDSWPHCAYCATPYAGRRDAANRAAMPIILSRGERVTR